MPAILYFHGFASSPRSQKIDALRALLAPDIELNAPDLNVPSFERLDFEQMVQLGVREGRRTPPRVIVGSSLGSMVALEVARRGIVAPLVLIAPALGVGDRWASRLPAHGDPVMVFNHALNAQAPIHRAFFDQMNGVHPDAEAPPVHVSIVMGRNDETVPFSLVRGVWDEWQAGIAPGSRFIDIAGGDHGLVAHAEVMAREIRALARPSP